MVAHFRTVQDWMVLCMMFGTTEIVHKVIILSVNALSFELQASNILTYNGKP